MADKKQEKEKQVQLQLLRFWASPFSQRVDLALALKGIQYEKLEQNLADKSPLLLASNPVYKTVPVLLHGDHAVCESSIILQYIDEAFPESQPPLLPADAFGRATARFWADFVDKKICEGLLLIFKSRDDARRAATEDFMDSLKAFNDALGSLSGGNKSLPYFGGEKMGFVDLMFAPLIPWLPALEIVGDFKFPVFEDKYPHLHNWLSAFKKSSIASVLPKTENVTEYGVPALRRREAAS